MDFRHYFRLLKKIWTEKVVALDYPWHPRSRYGQEEPISRFIQSCFEDRFQHFSQHIPQFISFLPNFRTIGLEASSGPGSVYWQNNYFPGLDVICLYTLVREIKPKRILEIGSGHSTAVMRKAIQDGGLSTKLTAIDPRPRRNLAHLADELIPSALEQLQDFEVFFHLEEGDILFFDGSHLAMANTDVTVFFMEIVPRIAPGILIQIHDIYLPFDYPADMAGRGYNEQYLLAQLLYFGWPDKIEVIFPAFWMSRQPAFQTNMATALWSHLPEGIERHGGSFWFKLKH